MHLVHKRYRVGKETNARLKILRFWIDTRGGGQMSDGNTESWEGFRVSSNIAWDIKRY